MEDLVAEAKKFLIRQSPDDSPERVALAIAYIKGEITVTQGEFVLNKGKMRPDGTRAAANSRMYVLTTHVVRQLFRQGKLNFNL